MITAQATIGTPPMSQHGLKQPVTPWIQYWHDLFRTNLRLTARPRIDPIVAVRHHIEDGKLVVTKTTDGGKSWRKLTKGLPQEDSYDLVFRHALTVDETGERLAFGSTTGNFWISEDGGESWDQVSGTLPPVYCVVWK